MPTREEVYDVLRACHDYDVNHGGIQFTYKYVHARYAMIPRRFVGIYCTACRHCRSKLGSVQPDPASEVGMNPDGILVRAAGLEARARTCRMRSVLQRTRGSAQPDTVHAQRVLGRDHPSRTMGTATDRGTISCTTTSTTTKTQALSVWTPLPA